MHRWWDGLQWTGHVRPSVVDAPTPAASVPAEYAAAFEATHALQQRGGFAGALGGLGQQFLSAAVATQAPPAPARAGGTFMPQPHGPADAQPNASQGPPPVQPYGSEGPAPYATSQYGTPGTYPYGGYQAGGSGKAYGASEVLGGIIGNGGDSSRVGIAGGVKLILFGLVFLLVSSFFLIPEILSAHAGAGESTARGTVVDQHVSTGSKGGRLCSPEATFVVDGTTYRAQAGYSSSSCPSVGSSITVIYPTANPSDARVPESLGILMLLAVFPVAGLVLVVFGIRGIITGSSSILSGLRRLRS